MCLSNLTPLAVSVCQGWGERTAPFCKALDIITNSESMSIYKGLEKCKKREKKGKLDTHRFFPLNLMASMHCIFPYIGKEITWEVKSVNILCPYIFRYNVVIKWKTFEWDLVNLVLDSQIECAGFLFLFFLISENSLRCHIILFWHSKAFILFQQYLYYGVLYRDIKCSFSLTTTNIGKKM